MRYKLKLTGAQPGTNQIIVPDEIASHLGPNIAVWHRGNKVPASVNGGLVTKHTFDNISGATSYDDWGSFDATMYNTTETTGVVGNARSTSGSANSYIAVSNTDDLQDIVYSIAFWMKDWTSKFGVYNFYYNVAGSSNYGRHWRGIYVSGYKFQTAHVNNCAVGTVQILYSSIIDPTEWTHVAVTYDGTTEKIYLNGALDVSAAKPAPGYKDGVTHPFDIGREPASAGNATYNFLTGTIDQLYYYNRAISAGEVAQLYSGGDGLASPFVLQMYLPTTGIDEIEIGTGTPLPFEPEAANSAAVADWRPAAGTYWYFPRSPFYDMKVKVDSTWKQVADMKVKIAGEWKEVEKIWHKQDGTWHN